MQKKASATVRILQLACFWFWSCVHAAFLVKPRRLRRGNDAKILQRAIYRPYLQRLKPDRGKPVKTG